MPKTKGHCVWFSSIKIMCIYGVYIYIYTHIYIYIYIYMRCIYIYSYIYIYTHKIICSVYVYVCMCRLFQDVEISVEATGIVPGGICTNRAPRGGRGVAGGDDGRGDFSGPQTVDIYGISMEYLWDMEYFWDMMRYLWYFIGCNWNISGISPWLFQY